MSTSPWATASSTRGRTSSSAVTPTVSSRWVSTKGHPIFYSLGNFVWPNFSTAGATTAVAEIKVTPQGKFVPRLIPAFITSPGHPVLQG
ncbi:MAG TPA: hypothetical protein VF986_05575 [Actinomycetota bacterium]